VSFAFPDALALKLQLGGDYKTVVVNDRPQAYWRLGDREGYAQAVLSDGPAAYWRLEEASGTSAADTTAGAHTLTLPASDITYRVDGALADGTKGYALSGAQARATLTALAIGTTATIEFWIRPSSGATAYTQVIGTSGGGAGLYVNNSTMKLNLQVGGGGAGDRFNTTALTAGALYHVLISIAAGAATFYVNGVADGTAAGWPGISADSLFNVGAGGAALACTLIDEIAIYGYALSAQQAANHYALRTATIATVATATLADSSGNGAVLAAGQGVIMGQAALQPDAGACIAVDGTANLVTSSGLAAGNFGLADFSLEAWLYQDPPPYVTDSANSQRIVMGRVGGTGGNGWRLWYHPNTVILELFKNATSLWYPLFWTHAVVAAYQTWKHVVVTVDQAGRTASCYVNGVALGAQALDAALLGVPIDAATTTAFTLANSTFAPASKWQGRLDEVALYTRALSAAEIAEHYLAGQWTDVTADLTDEDLVLSYGIQSSRPEDRVATTGTLTFGLRNDAANSGATLGWYSPYNAARRTGFDFRIRTQLAVTYSGTTYYWTGRLRVIDAVPDSFGDRVTHCVAVDWLDEAARANTQVALQTNTDGGTAFAALVACVPNPPAATVAEAGSDSYVYAFDNIWQNVKVLSALADLARSELGYIYQRRDTTGAGETIVFENRHHRSLSSTLRASLSQVFDDLKVTNAADDIINRVRVRVYPRTTITNQVVAALSTSPSSPATILPGETQTIWLNYTDPVQRSSQIGAKDQIALAATTDYTMNTLADGTGTDLTAFLSVTAVNFGSSVKLTVTNAGTSAGVITKLQQRGTAIYALNPAEAESVTGTGETLATIDAPYQSDPTLAKLAADYIAGLFSSALANVQAVRFRANQSPTLLAAALAGEISDLVQLQEDVTGLTTAQNFYINAVGLRFGLNGLIDCTWRLAPADTAQYWVLGVAGASELGTTTRLGF
jgi:hypothetical protein